MPASLCTPPAGLQDPTPSPGAPAPSSAPNLAMAGGGAIASASSSRADLYNGGLNAFVILVAILVRPQTLVPPPLQGRLASWPLRVVSRTTTLPQSTLHATHLPPSPSSSSTQAGSGGLLCECSGVGVQRFVCTASQQACMPPSRWVLLMRPNPCSTPCSTLVHPVGYDIGVTGGVVSMPSFQEKFFPGKLLGVGVRVHLCRPGAWPSPAPAHRPAGLRRLVCPPLLVQSSLTA